jgi:hypothetical protein
MLLLVALPMVPAQADLTHPLGVLAGSGNAQLGVSYDLVEFPLNAKNGLSVNLGLMAASRADVLNVGSTGTAGVQVNLQVGTGTPMFIGIAADPGNKWRSALIVGVKVKL